MKLLNFVSDEEKSMFIFTFENFTDATYFVGKVNEDLSMNLSGNATVFPNVELEEGNNVVHIPYSTDKKDAISCLDPILEEVVLEAKSNPLLEEFFSEAKEEKKEMVNTNQKV